MSDAAVRRASWQGGFRVIAVLMLLLGMMLSTGGCQNQGKITLRSQVSPEMALSGQFDRGVYGYDDQNTLHVLLFDGPEDAPRQIVHLQMFWLPRAGLTPVDRRATNATVRYILLQEDKAGVYGGAGFLYPKNQPGSKVLRAELRDASMKLLDASEAFEDAIGYASMAGVFRAHRDDEAVQVLLHQVERQLHEALEYPRFVQGVDISNAG